MAEATDNAAIAEPAIASGKRFARRILLSLIDDLSPPAVQPARRSSLRAGTLQTPPTHDRFSEPTKTSWLLPMGAIRQVTASDTAMPPMCRARARPTVGDEPGREPVQPLKRQAHEQQSHL